MSPERPPAPHIATSFHLARFAASLALLVGISLVGVAFESQELGVRRRLSLETFRADQLQSRIATLQLKVEQLQTPSRLQNAIEPPKIRVAHPDAGRAR
jgi:hypothetical protein